MQHVVVKVGFSWPGVYPIIRSAKGGRYVLNTGEALGRTFHWDDLDLIERPLEDVLPLEKMVRVELYISGDRKWFTGRVKRNQKNSDVVMIVNPGTTGRAPGALMTVRPGARVTMAAEV